MGLALRIVPRLYNTAILYDILNMPSTSIENHGGKELRGGDCEYRKHRGRKLKKLLYSLQST